MSTSVAIKEPMEGMIELSKDLRRAAAVMPDEEAKYIISMYYNLQDHRIGASNRQFQLDQRVEPSGVVGWIKKNMLALERNMIPALNEYAKGKPHGRWLLAQHGIGPIIAAGLLAHIDVTVPHTSAIMAYAGQVPGVLWMSEEKTLRHMKNHLNIKGDFNELVVGACHVFKRNPSRIFKRLEGQKQSPSSLAKLLAKPPWNSDLKTLVWKIGEMFKNGCGNEKCDYGKIYLIMKHKYDSANRAGKYSSYAASRVGTVDKGTVAHAFYSGCYRPDIFDKVAGVLDEKKRASVMRKERLGPGAGLPMIPPAQVMARAKRWAACLLLSHYHQVGHFLVTGNQCSRPYIMDHGVGHADFIAPYHLDAVGLRANGCSLEKDE